MKCGAYGRLFGAAVAAASAAWIANIAVVRVAALDGDVLVSVGSPATPFSQNKQNEPAVAIDPTNPAVVVAGANDMPFHGRRRRIGRLLFLQFREHLDAADLHRLHRQRLSRSGPVHAARWSDRDAARLLREWPRLRWRSSCGLRTAA